MEPKKISFSFTKVTQKMNLLPQNNTRRSKIELIECLEGQTIKIKDAVEEVKRPLIIPIRDSTKNLLERVKETRRVKSENVDGRPDSELSLDELAAKQLIEEATVGNEIKHNAKVLKLPTVPYKPLIEDKEEPNLADYENVPIEDYGLAMLRGMGWAEGVGIGKNQKVINPVEPELRPKGMGLGATTLVNAEKKPPPVDKDGKELVLVKGAHAKIIAGGHRGNYCEVLGLDDESGRIIVKTSIKNLILSLNEFLVQAVTAEEYAKSSKVLNNVKYEQYKEKSKLKAEVHSSSGNSSDHDKKQSKHNSNSDKNKNHRRFTRQEHDAEKTKRKSHKTEKRRSRSRSYDRKARTSKHRDRSCSSETDHSDSSVEYRSRRDSDSSDYSGSKNNERDRKHEDSHSEFKKKKSKKQKHSSSREHKKSKNKDKKKYRGTSSDSDQSDRGRRKHRHSNHKDSHKISRR